VTAEFNKKNRAAPPSIGRAPFNAALPREGKIARQCRRCLLVNDGVASMRELREHWCYVGQPRQHWHHWSIVRALIKLGAQRIGWGFMRSGPS
jgi:hypothetical protein